MVIWWWVIGDLTVDVFWNSCWVSAFRLFNAIRAPNKLQKGKIVQHPTTSQNIIRPTNLSYSYLGSQNVFLSFQFKPQVTNITNILPADNLLQYIIDSLNHDFTPPNYNPNRHFVYSVNLDDEISPFPITDLETSVFPQLHQSHTLIATHLNCVTQNTLLLEF